MTVVTETRRGLPDFLVYAAFWTSGVAAVLYQLIWQRVLLGVYGLQAESVAIVVSGFLLGIGSGTIVGGWLGERWPHAALRLFAAAEAALACVGAVSVVVFRYVGAATADVGIAATFALVMALLLVPTTLMGATFPILCGYAVRRRHSVGLGVSGFYAANTLGSAGGAIAAIVFIVEPLGQQGTVWLAASLNAVAAIVGLVADRGVRTRP